MFLKYALRSGDAIQLASALVLRESIGPLDAFIAHDTRLAAVAVGEGLTI